MSAGQNNSPAVENGAVEVPAEGLFTSNPTRAVAAVGQNAAADRLVDKLDKVKPIGANRWLARCPAHDDGNPSLSVTAVDGRVLTYCFAGCQTVDIVSAVGLSMPDLFDNPKELEYRYDNGRTAKRFYRADGSKGFSQSSTDRSPELYRLAKVRQAVSEHVDVYVAEGEEDVRALESLGVVATSAPQGAGNWDKADYAPLKGSRVFVCADLDEPGKKRAEGLTAHLRSLSIDVGGVLVAKTGNDMGDHVAAGHGLSDLVHRTITNQAASVDLVGSTWDDLDISDVIQGVIDGTIERPTPTIGIIGNGRGLLYPGKVHGIHGVGGSGKTWLAAFAIAEQITAGHHVILIDLEDVPETIIRRLVVDLGVDPASIRSRFHYKRPAETARVGASVLHATVTKHQCSLVVLDSTGESLAVDGVRQNEDAEVAAWMSAVARSTADLGPAVLLLDHVPKADERSLMPIGSQRKQAAMNGAIYSVQELRPFSQDQAGAALIVCGKDRQGTYTRGQRVAEMKVTPTPTGTVIELVETAQAPRNENGTLRPTYLMEKVSLVVEAAGGATGNFILKSVTGKREAAIRALSILVDEGYITRTEGARNSWLHESVKPYRQTSDTGNQSAPETTVTGSGSLRVGTGEPVVNRFREPVGTGGNQSDDPGYCVGCGGPLPCTKTRPECVAIREGNL